MVFKTGRIVSTNLQPVRLWQPKPIFRHKTADHIIRSRWLLVGSTAFLSRQEGNDTANETDGLAGLQALDPSAFSPRVLAHLVGLYLVAATSYEHSCPDDLPDLVPAFLKRLQPSLVSHSLRIQVFS